MKVYIIMNCNIDDHQNHIGSVWANKKDAEEELTCCSDDDHIEEWEVRGTP